MIFSSSQEISRARRIIGEETFLGLEEKSEKKTSRPKLNSSKKRASFDRDYPAFLLSLGSAIRTGQDPLVAMYKVGELFQSNSSIAEELVRFKENIERGLHENDCIMEFGKNISHPDLPLFRTAFILARRQGSSLSRCLERLVRVTRQRQSFRRKVKAAIAMQKLSSLGIGFCAAIICLFQIVTNSQGLTEAIAHPTGSRLLIVSGSLIIIGIGWMLRIASREA